MESFVRGFTGAFTPNKLGMAAGLVAILVALHFFGWDPASLSAKVRQQTGG